MTNSQTQTSAQVYNGEVQDSGEKMTETGKGDALGVLMKGPKENNKFCHEIGKIKDGPEDKTPMAPTVGQVKTVCAAGHKCKEVKGKAVGYAQRCMVCGYCLHGMCGMKIEDSAKRTAPKKANRVCLGCIHVLKLENKVHKVANEEVISLRHAKLHKYLRDSYPKLVLLNPLAHMDEDDDDQEPSDDDPLSHNQRSAEDIVNQGEATNARIDEAIQEMRLDEDSAAEEWKSIQRKVRNEKVNPYKKPIEVPDPSDSDDEDDEDEDDDVGPQTQDMDVEEEEDRKPAAVDRNNKSDSPEKRQKDQEPSAGPSDSSDSDSEDDEDDNVEADDGASEVTAGKGNKAGNQTRSKPTKEIPTIRRFLDVQLNGNKPTDGSPGAAVQASILTCRTWMEGIHSVVPSFKLHKTDGESHQTILHDLQDFPKDLQELKAFFKGVRPSFDTQRLWLKVLAEWQGTEATLISNVGWYHKQKNESIRISSIQAASTTTIGWMLYSTRFNDTEFWSKTWSALCGVQVAARWKRISDGAKYDPKRDMSKDPKALHVECASDDSTTVSRIMSLHYGTESKKFPKGTKMRIVPLVQTLTGDDNKRMRKFAVLLNRQNGWTRQVLTTTTEGIAVDIDDPHSVDFRGKSLRQVIMKWKFCDPVDKKITSLFSSIDKSWNQRGWVFQFHPRKNGVAQAMVKGLIARLAAKYPDLGKEGIQRYFTPEAILENEQMIWDPKSKTMTSLADKAVDKLMDVDPDMDVDDEEVEVLTEEPVLIYQRDRGNEDDSVSTFRSKGKRRKPEAEGTPTKKPRTSAPATPESDLSSLTAGTRDAFMARIRELESVVQNLSSRLTTQGTSASASPGVATGTTVTPNGERNTADARASQPEQIYRTKKPLQSFLKRRGDL